MKVNFMKEQHTLNSSWLWRAPESIEKLKSEFNAVWHTTHKYRPDYPGRFGSIKDAREYCRSVFQWYNMEHRRSGIAIMTPNSVHYGISDKMWERRSMILMPAYMEDPERFVGGVPSVKRVPREVWINKPIVKEQVPQAVT